MASSITFSFFVAAIFSVSAVQAEPVNNTDDKLLREIQLAIPHYYVGQTSNGLAVYISETGRWNYRPFMKGGPVTAKFFESVAGFYSQLQQSEKGSILIADMKGFDTAPLLHPTGQKFLVDQIALFDKIGGGSGLKAVYIVNGNQDWTNLFNSFKSNFAQTAGRFKNLGKNVTEWSPELLQFLNLDVTRMLSSVTVSPLQAILDEELPARIRAKFPYYLSGYSPEGCPVFTAAPGRYDFKSVFDEGPEGIELYSKRTTQMFLRIYTDGLRVPGSPGSLFIVDMKGFSAEQTSDPKIRKALVDGFKKFDKICAGPGLRRVYIINAKEIFAGMFSEAKSDMKNTLDRFEVYGENAAEWTSVLKSALRPPLPEEYGGVRGYSPIYTY